jgi:hypothetical protein
MTVTPTVLAVCPICGTGFHGAAYIDPDTNKMMVSGFKPGTWYRGEDCKHRFRTPTVPVIKKDLGRFGQ